MRVVGIAVITALLSAGCAIQAGEPTPDEMQRPNELVGLPGGEQPSVSARPQAVTRGTFGQNGPQSDSPNPSPWTGGGSSDPHAGGGPSGSGSGGGMNDNPNPSPWANPSDPRWGGASIGGSKAGNGG
jgi:hypothetical protein